MKQVNLRKLYYPHYTQDCYIDVPDEIAEELAKFDRAEHAYHERTRYHKAYYSLDVGDGIEKDALVSSASPQELYEQKVVNSAIYAAIHALPEIQSKRIYAHFFCDMRKAEIARIEGVSTSTIWETISRGLKTLAAELKDFK